MNRIVEFALRQRLLIVGIFVAMLVAGGVGFYNLNIEAYPDPVPPMVEIITQTQGLSAEEMERNVTIPIEVGMAGIPHLTAIRAISLFGLSDIKIQFSYDLTNDQAKQQVINRLSQLPPLTGGAQPTVAAIVSALTAKPILVTAAAALAGSVPTTAAGLFIVK